MKTPRLELSLLPPGEFSTITVPLLTDFVAPGSQAPELRAAIVSFKFNYETRELDLKLQMPQGSRAPSEATAQPEDIRPMPPFPAGIIAKLGFPDLSRADRERLVREYGENTEEASSAGPGATPEASL